jgi:hypothetical protein
MKRTRELFELENYELDNVYNEDQNDMYPRQDSSIWYN